MCSLLNIVQGHDEMCSGRLRTVVPLYKHRSKKADGLAGFRHRGRDLGYPALNIITSPHLPNQWYMIVMMMVLVMFHQRNRQYHPYDVLR